MSDLDLSKLSNEQLTALHAAGGDLTKLPDNILQSFSAQVPDATNPGMPTRGDVISPENMPQDEFAGNVVTRIRNAATGLLGAPRATADFTKKIADDIGAPKWAAAAANQLNPLTLAGQFMPSGEQINKTMEDKTGFKPVATPGPAGPAIDAGVETAIGALAGGPRALIPALTGGAAQQVAGDIPGVKGSKWEPYVRLGASLFGSLGPAAAQRGVEAATNTAALRTPENRAAAVLGRNLDRDNMTFGQLQGAHVPGTPLVTNAGDNVTGALRGTTAAQGPARTTVNKAFEDYTEGSEGRVGDAITKNISDLPPISTRINTLEGEQSAASRPAYERAGVLLPTETQTGDTRIRPEQVSPERTVKFAIDQPATTIPAQWNTMPMESPALTGLYKDSSIVRSAMGQIRGLSEYKNVPPNTMVMWDQVYKVLGGMEREAARGGNDRRAMLIGDERRNVLAAITEQNPRYQRALNAYSEPQKLIDASQTGRDWFSKNMPVDAIKKAYADMPPDQRREALGGIADYLRTKMGGTDRMTAGERLLNSGNERGRLQSVLPAGDFAKFNALIEQEKAVAAKGREVTKGSRSVPMANEQADNAGIDLGAGLGILHKVATGNFKLAALDLLRTAAAPIAKRMVGKSNEATNATLANWLTESDPQKIGLVRSLAEQARAQEAARRMSQQRGLTFGTLAPALSGIIR